MYTLQSILKNATSFANAYWQIETLPMPLRKAERLLESRDQDGARRYRLVKA
jgi:hypothetical protein